jgi:23S rRNA pseudouridine1911/1915/1917 synthase
MKGESAFRVVVAEKKSPIRLDAYLAAHIPDLSRSQARHLILSGAIRVDGSLQRPAYRVKKGDCITGALPDPSRLSLTPDPRELHILYEDGALIALNKPPGLVVHPAPGHWSKTLVNALLFRYPELRGVGDPARPGIVHRLDKDTSGVLVVARTSFAHQHLLRQFKTRQAVKSYLAIVQGTPKSEEGWIALSIGRHPKDRKRMSTKSPKGRAAETRWRIRQHFHDACLLEIGLKTGRTHQVRVHCAALGCPVAGDPVYGKRKRRETHDPQASGRLYRVHRQMLHAWRLEVIHPVTSAPLRFEAPVPEDMKRLILELENAAEPEGRA